MRFPARRTFQRLNHNLFNLRVTDLARRAGAQLIAQRVDAALQKSRAPFPHHTHRTAQFVRDGLVGQPFGTCQNHSRPSRQDGLTTRPMRQRLQLLALFVR